MSTYQREPWQAWAARRLLHIGYWPQYMAWQTDWVHFDAQALVAGLVDAGVEVLEWGVPENYPAVSAGCSRRHPALAGLDDDPYARLIEACHRSDIKVLFWGPSNALLEGDLEYWGRHADSIRAQGESADPVMRNTNMCFHNELFMRVHLERIRALVSSYDVDGLCIDGPWPKYGLDHERGVFTCAYCQASFARFAGTDRAPRQDWNDPLWRCFLRWRFESIAAYHQAVYRAVKEVDERLFVTENSQVFPELSWRMPYTNPNDFHASIDSPFNECPINSYWMLGVSMNVKFMRASAEGRIPGIYHKTMDMPFLTLETGFAQAVPSAVDSATVAFLALAHGAWVSFHLSMDDRARPHPARLRVTGEVARQVKPKLAWLTESTPLDHAAICYSVPTRDFWAGAAPEAWMRSFLGAERALVESHIPSHYVFDGQLDAAHLAGCRLLVLPNVACLSDAGAAAVRDHVQGGGALLATGETSLYDADERFRGQFALQDVLGVRFGGVNPVTADIDAGRQIVTGVFTCREHPARSGAPDSHADIAYYPWFTVEADADREVLATWARLKTGTIHACVNLGREIEGDSGMPAIVAGRYGRGRVVYIHPDLTAMYTMHSLKATRELLASLCQWLAPAAVRYHGPMAVELTVMEQRRHDRLVVHLVNYATYHKGHGSLMYHPFLDANKVWRPFSTPMHRDTARSDMAAPMADVAQRYRQPTLVPEIFPCDEYLPVFDTTLQIARSLLRGRTIRLEPEGIPLAPIEAGEHAQVVIPRIDIHRMLVVA